MDPTAPERDVALDRPADQNPARPAPAAPAPAAAAAFDLSEIESLDVDELTINHPVTGAPTTWTMQLAGPGHPVTLALQRQAQRERLELNKRIETTRANGKKWKGEDVDPEEEKTRIDRRAAQRILGWSAVTHNGVAFPYTPENALALFAEPRWTKVWQQIMEHFDSDAAFTKRSART